MKKRLYSLVSIVTALALLLSMAIIPTAALAQTIGYASTKLESGGARVHNIKRAAADLSATVVRRNSTFSFNEAVSNRVRSNGYEDAVNGRGVNVIAGGAGQVAATLYLAVKDMPGIRIDKISFFGNRYRGSYVSNGNLAVLVDWESGIDFTFTNLTGSDLIIYAWVDDNDHEMRVSIDTTTITTTIASASIPLNGSNSQRSNISLAAQSINQVQLKKGDVFSFNSVVGPREASRGYRDGINGRGIEVLGGGVGQVASVVWLAIKQLSTVQLLEKRTYAERYNQSYVASAEDAILIDYTSNIDFRFRYVGNETITINTYVIDNNLVCNISTTEAVG